MIDEFRAVGWARVEGSGDQGLLPIYGYIAIFSRLLFVIIAFGDYTPHMRHTRAILLISAARVSGCVLASHSGVWLPQGVLLCTHGDFGRARPLHAACSTSVLHRPNFLLAQLDLTCVKRLICDLLPPK